MELIQRLHGRDILPKNMLLHVPRQLLGIVLRKLSIADIEDTVQLFESEVLCLRQQEIAIYPAEEVPCGVPRTN